MKCDFCVEQCDNPECFTRMADDKDYKALYEKALELWTMNLNSTRTEFNTFITELKTMIQVKDQVIEAKDKELFELRKILEYNKRQL